ncbi:unnamed protein product [Blepharisma stoltei]|uniref:J domain-containing protein n=1 Tax=Blepharisma stoltei TaxID=1481888 RepID=A0AAU9IUM3_9CILI|nr:unnamed protein product [Blepharisma stoltei]
MDENDDLYKVLDVDKDANPTEIKKAYYKLARQYHPDKNLDDPEVNNKKFQEISNAYDTLGNSDKKGYYDFLSSLQLDLGNASSGLKESIAEEMKNCQRYTESPVDEDYFTQFEISVKRQRRRKRDVGSKNKQEGEEKDKITLEEKFKRVAWEWMFLEENPSPQRKKRVRKKQTDREAGDSRDGSTK